MHTHTYTHTDIERDLYPSGQIQGCISTTILLFLSTAFDRVNTSLILETLSPPICWSSALEYSQLLLSLLCFLLLLISKRWSVPGSGSLSTLSPNDICTLWPQNMHPQFNFSSKLLVYISSCLLDIACWHLAGISNLTYLKHHS